MKYASLILASFASSLSAMAYVSPLGSAQDYIFTRPSMTNLISGFIMGETPSYYTVRYEDLAFIHEANAERAFVVQSNYSEDETTSRGFPVVEKPKNRIGLGYYSNRDEYLDPSEELSNTIRIITPASNVVEIYEWIEVGQDGTETGMPWSVTNVISQVMTNMSENAYTNAPISWRTNIIIKVTTTNLMSAADWCMKTRHKNYNEYIEKVRAIKPQRQEALISLDTITNEYHFLKSTTRTIPTGCHLGYRLFTNETTFTFYNGTNVTVETYSEYMPSYSKQIDRTGGFYGNSYEPKGNHHVAIRANSPYLSNVTGDFQRVTGAFVFAAVYVRRDYTYINGDERIEDSKSAIAMVPLGKAYPMNAKYGYNLHLHLVIQDFKSIATSVADLAGIPYDVDPKINEDISFDSYIGPYGYSDFYVVLETSFKTEIP